MGNAILGSVLTFTFALGMISPSAAADADNFYKGKTINIIVGYRAGGGYDTFTRAVARHMGRHIPGNPAIVVSNKGGAGSLIAANTILS